MQPNTTTMYLQVTGRIGAGKTTLCNALAQLHGFVVLSIGDLIKAEVAQAFPNYAEERKHQWRSLLQAWGNARRLECPDYWIAKMLTAIRQYKIASPAQALVLDSIRSPAEIKAFGEAGFCHVHLVLPLARSVDYLEKRGVPRREAEIVVSDRTEAWLQQTSTWVGAFSPGIHVYTAGGPEADRHVLATVETFMEAQGWPITRTMGLLPT